MNQVATKKPYLGYFCRFVTRAFTSTFLKQYLVFEIFEPLSVGFKAKNKLIPFYTKF